MWIALTECTLCVCVCVCTVCVLCVYTGCSYCCSKLFTNCRTAIYRCIYCVWRKADRLEQYISLHITVSAKQTNKTQHLQCQALQVLHLAVEKLVNSFLAPIALRCLMKNALVSSGIKTSLQKFPMNPRYILTNFPRRTACKAKTSCKIIIMLIFTELRINTWCVRKVMTLNAWLDNWQRCSHN